MDGVEAQGQGIETPKAASEVRTHHVIAISVDGLRSDVLSLFGPAELPHFHRLLGDSGTLDARCDIEWPLTLPNHTSMLTGRLAGGDAGHRWTGNGLTDDGVSLHSQAGHYVSSVFDVTHDDGVHTALFAGKEKFVLFDRSYNEVNGQAPTHGTLTGRDKIDQYRFDMDSSVLLEATIAHLTGKHRRTFTFLHIRDPDGAGHGNTWDVSPGSPYMASIRRVDQWIGRLFEGLDSKPELARHAAVILTADHGGGAPPHSHQAPDSSLNFRIPFLVWRGGHGDGLDLYRVNQSSRDHPGAGNPIMGPNGKPPIRNADLANLALSLLVLPAVPGSTVNVEQDLVVHLPHSSPE